MARCEVVVHIDAPVERVWSLYTQLASKALWLEAVGRIDPLPGQGVRYRIRYRGPYPASVVEVAASEPLRYHEEHFAGGPISGIWRAWFRSVGGQTELRYESDAKLALGPLGRIVERWTRKQTERLHRGEVERLKALAESK